MGIQIYTINFANEIGVHEISQFRGAVISAVGRDNGLFHDHEGDNYRYSYPLIQYKRLRGRAAIVCLGDGVDAVGALLRRDSTTLLLGGRHLLNLAVDSIDAQDCCFAADIAGCTHSYRLRRWLPLNAENYRRYRSTQSLAERVSLLERIVVGNILSMAGGLSLFVDVPVEVKITSVREHPRAVEFKGVRMMAFDVDFLTNIDLPVNVGLGKGCSIGFGIVEKLEDKN